MNLEKLTIKAQEAISNAQQIAIGLGQQQIEPEHVLLSLLNDTQGTIPVLFKKLGVNPVEVKNQINKAVEKLPKVYGEEGKVYASSNLNLLLNRSMQEAKSLKDEYVSTEHLFLAMLIHITK